jgi:hypothetical protein
MIFAAFATLEAIICAYGHTMASLSGRPRRARWPSRPRMTQYQNCRHSGQLIQARKVNRDQANLDPGCSVLPRVHQDNQTQFYLMILLGCGLYT